MTDAIQSRAAAAAFAAVSVISLLLCILVIGRRLSTIPRLYMFVDDQVWTWTSITTPPRSMPRIVQWTFALGATDLRVGRDSFQIDPLANPRWKKTYPAGLMPVPPSMTAFSGPVGGPLPNETLGLGVLQMASTSWAASEGGVRTASSNAAQAPLWWIAAVLSILPLCWEVAHRRQLLRNRRAWQSICRQCGYDLRCSPIRCPECGTPIERPPPTPFRRLLYAEITFSCKSPPAPPSVR